MSRTMLAGTLTALLLSIPLSLDAQEDERQEIRALIEGVAAAMQAGDLAALDSTYAPGEDVHIIEGAGVNHGWEEYRDHHLEPELEAFENFEYRYFSVEPRIVGDVAYAGLRYELKATTERGDIHIEGRGTFVLEKMDGRWRVVHTHTSGRPVR